MGLNKGQTNSGSFKKGFKPWNKGKEGKKGTIPWNKGKKHSEDRRISKKGHPAWNKGLRPPQEQIERQRAKLIGRKVPENILDKLRANILKGENHPNWNGGSSKGYKKGYRDNLAYKKWRTSVFERDGYTCQGCGITGVYITAHHIKSFAKYPELRLEISNGLTLCEDCHKKTDNYKGKESRK